jgi:hypothetical protein
MPPTVARVDHPGFGVLNCSVEIKVYLKPEMYPCKEMSCFVFGTLIQLSDQCTCQIFCNTSNSNFGLIWRNLSIFTTSIPIRVVPKVFSFVQDVPAKAVFIFGSNFDQSCSCSFNGLFSIAMLVNDTQIRCIFPQEKAEAFNISVICDGLSSEPIHFFPSVEDTSSFYVESFANAIDGSTSCATVVGSRLNLIKRADLCDQAVDVARSNATQVLNICVAGRHISCRLQLFDNVGTGLYSTVVESSSMGVLSI